MSLRVTVLGSGTIIPSIDRRATALMVEADDEPYLFECGPAVLEAMEELGFSFRSVYNIFLSHLHPDHTLDIGRLIPAINNDGASVGRKRLAIYGPPGLKRFMQQLNEVYRGTVPKWDYLELIEVESGDVTRKGLVSIRATPAVHGDIPALAYRIDSGTESIFYTGDSEYCESVVKLATGAGLLVAECSFPDERPVAGHMTPTDVGRLAAETDAARTLLIHMYPDAEDADPIASVKKQYKGPVAAARDGMVIDLGEEENKK